MKQMIRSFILVLLFSPLVSCVGGSHISSQSPVVIKRLTFLNQSSSDIHDVRLYVMKTREFVECGYVPANSECSSGFPLRTYQGNKFKLSWKLEGTSRSVDNIAVEGIAELAAKSPVDVVIMFDQRGQVRARFVQ